MASCFAASSETVCRRDASQDEVRLVSKLFRSYNNLIRPVSSVNVSQKQVNMAMQLVLLISVNEKNQIMHTNVWLTITWTDFQMAWTPSEYGEIKTIRIPPEKIWSPDIVLFNNADGNYEVSYYSNVVVSHTGDMLWVPPAIYKSSCIIDVEHFPFDQQVCTMNFGSWTYNQREVELGFNKDLESIDMSSFYKSSIWDVIDCPASKNSRRNRIEYRLVLRRKTLFYTVVLIVPTVVMSFLSMIVFYLPTDAGEKISLAISILLSLVVFMLLVSRILPPTSKTIPLMAKYLLLTFVLNVVTIMVTIVVINVFFRGPTTHTMPRWVKRLFIDFLAGLLCMRRPNRSRTVARLKAYPASAPITPGSGLDSARPLAEDSFHATYGGPVGHNSNTVSSAFGNTTVHHHQNCPFSRSYSDEATEVDQSYLLSKNILMPLPPEAFKALEAIDYITEHLREDDEIRRQRADWKYVAMVIDRLLLYVFFGITFGGTVGIILSAPTVFDKKINQDEIIAALTAKYTSS